MNSREIQFPPLLSSGDSLMAISPETIAKMANAFADEIGEHFASEPNQEKVLVWLDIIRNEMIDDCCSPVSAHA